MTFGVPVPGPGCGSRGQVPGAVTPFGIIHARHASENRRARSRRRPGGRATAGGPDRPLAVHQPRAELAGVQPARPRSGQRPGAPAARAREVPGHRRGQPRRVLHGPRGHAAEEVPRRRRRHVARRPEHRAAAARHSPARRADARRRRDLLAGAAAAAARQRSHPVPRAGRLHAGGQDVSGGLLQDAHLARADAAGLRPRPPVPVHLEPEPQLCRRRAAQRAHEVRAREGARQAAALCRDPRAQGRARVGRPPHADLRVHRGRDPAEHPGAVSGHAGQERAPVPHRPRHGHGDPGRRGRRPARKRGPQPSAAAVRGAVAAAGRGQHAAPRAGHPGRELRGGRGRRPAHVRSPGLCRLHGADRRCTGRP